MDDAFIKLDRAKELREQLLVEVGNFWPRQKITCSIENKRATYRVKLDELPNPNKISCIFSDIIQNLISSLDYIAYSEYKNNPEKTLVEKDVYFKIYNSKIDFEKVHAMNFRKNVSERFNKLMIEVKPYKEVSETLWQLKKINIICKHRNIIFAHSRVRGVDIGGLFQSMGIQIPEFSLSLVPAEDNFMEEDGLIFTDAEGSDCNPHQKFTFDLRILEDSVFDTKVYLGDFIEKSIVEVEKVLNVFKG